MVVITMTFPWTVGFISQTDNNQVTCRTFWYFLFFFLSDLGFNSFLWGQLFLMCMNKLSSTLRSMISSAIDSIWKAGRKGKVCIVRTFRLYQSEKELSTIFNLSFKQSAVF